MSTEHTIRLGNGKTFTARADITILDAALAAGITLEHSCRTGRCGSCKTQRLSGPTERIVHDLYLDDAQRSAGWILTCAEAARGDVSIDAEDLSKLNGIVAKTLPARLDALSILSEDVVHVVLRLPPNNGFQFLAGQYVNIIGANGLRRSYSIAQSPRADGKLEFYIRKVDAGAMSAYWFGTAKPNDLLRIEGPRGTFFLREVAGQDIYLLATGTGIAPIRAMLSELASRPAQAQPRSVHLYWGGRKPEDLFWKPDVAGLPLEYVPVLSRADAGWAGARGHVQDVLLATRPDLLGAQIYACGSTMMIETAREQLCAAGLPRKSFYSDAFVSSE